MSSLRNAVHRRQHRERGQLTGREKWGILEKHKDYSLRAKDYNAKKAQIKRLKEKARDRNPDEFAFGMMSATSRVQGRHGAAARDSATARGLSHEAIKLLKTQDAGYLRVVGERIRREIDRLDEDMQLQAGIGEVLRADDDDEEGHDSDEDDHGLGFKDLDLDEKALKGKRTGQQKIGHKVLFADDRAQQRELKKRLREGSENGAESRKDSDDDEHGDTPFGKRQVSGAQRKSRKQLLAERQALVEARRARKMKKRAAEARQNKLNALKKQYQEIVAAERELDRQRGKMDNSVGGTNKDGIKWKIRERKK